MQNLDLKYVLQFSARYYLLSLLNVLFCCVFIVTENSNVVPQHRRQPSETPAVIRTDSPDNDSAFSDSVSLLSSESSASSGRTDLPSQVNFCIDIISAVVAIF